MRVLLARFVLKPPQAVYYYDPITITTDFTGLIVLQEVARGDIDVLWRGASLDLRSRLNNNGQKIEGGAHPRIATTARY